MFDMHGFATRHKQTESAMYVNRRVYEKSPLRYGRMYMILSAMVAYQQKVKNVKKRREKYWTA